MMKKIIILACSVLVVNAVSAQSDKKQTSTSTTRQPVPLAATAEVNTVKTDAAGVTANATVNNIGVNLVAAPIDVQPSPEGTRTMHDNNVPATKENEIPEVKKGTRK